jgi:uncharacterized membrane protein (UPF0182 family)
MQRLKQWLFRLMMLALLAGLGYVALGLFFSQFLVDLWWFQSQGYSALFGLRLTYKYLVFLGFSLIFFVVFFLNFWITGRFLSRPAPADSQESKRFEGFRKVAAHFRRGSLRVYTPFSLLLGVSVAYPLYRDWEAALLYVFGPAAGVVDPVFGKDISYYLFSLPIYLLLLDELFIAHEITACLHCGHKEISAVLTIEKL